jgi:hypothetical protein
MGHLELAEGLGRETSQSSTASEMLSMNIARTS